MTKIWMVILSQVFAVNAFAAVLNSGAIPVQSEIVYYEFEVKAKCQGPKFEDDAHRVYFDSQSYTEIQSYMDKGYTMVLLDRSCGYRGKGAALSEDSYETVRILMYNTHDASKAIDVNVKALLQAYGVIEP